MTRDSIIMAGFRDIHCQYWKFIIHVHYVHVYYVHYRFLVVVVNRNIGTQPKYVIDKGNCLFFRRKMDISEVRVMLEHDM